MHFLLDSVFRHSNVAQFQTGGNYDVIFSTLTQEHLLKLTSAVDGPSLTHSSCMNVTSLKSFTFGNLGFPSGQQIKLLAGSVLAVLIWHVSPFLDLPHFIFLRATH